MLLDNIVKDVWLGGDLNTRPRDYDSCALCHNNSGIYQEYDDFSIALDSLPLCGHFQKFRRKCTAYTKLSHICAPMRLSPSGLVLLSCALAWAVVIWGVV